MSSTERNALGPARERSRSVWLLAVLTYGVGDSLTTVVGTAGASAAEAGPLAAAFLDAWGVGGLLLLKGLVLAAFYALWRALDTPGRVAVPLSLAAVGTAVTAWNLSVLL